MQYIKEILIIGLVLSILGYILIVLREKYYLKKNIIILDNSSVSSEDLQDIDMNQMSYRGLRLKTGDEIKIVTDRKVYKGTLIGGKFKEGILKIITYSDEIKEVNVKNILEVKLVREYGKFFTS